MFALEAIALDPARTEFERARASAFAIMGHATLRRIDAQRSRPTGQCADALDGWAALKKGRARKKMKPFAWQCPTSGLLGDRSYVVPCLVSLDELGEVDFIFRRLSAPRGHAGSPRHATAWEAGPSTAAHIHTALTELLSGPPLCLEGEELESFTLHSFKHYVPELAKALEARLSLSEPDREGLGYWAGADDAAGTHADAAAPPVMTRALRQTESMSDRYAHRASAPRQLAIRMSIMAAVRDCVSAWYDGDYLSLPTKGGFAEAVRLPPPPGASAPPELAIVPPAVATRAPLSPTPGVSGTSLAQTRPRRASSGSPRQQRKDKDKRQRRGSR